MLGQAGYHKIGIFFYRKFFVGLRIYCQQILLQRLGDIVKRIKSMSFINDRWRLLQGFQILELWLIEIHITFPLRIKNLFETIQLLSIEIKGVHIINFIFIKLSRKRD